jgi:hypothetical protein
MKLHMSDVFRSIHGPSFRIDGPGMMDVLLHDAGRDTSL